MCVFKILLLGYVLLLLFSHLFVCLFGVCVLFVCLFLFDGENVKFVLHQTMVDMTAEHPVNETLAIRRIPRDLHYSVNRYSVMRFIQVYRKQTVWVED